MSQKKHRKRKWHLNRLTIGIIAIIFLCAGTLYLIHTYNQSRIYGRWQSQETQKIVEFKKNGKVLLKTKGAEGEFVLLAPNKMTYTIDGRVFEMYYKVDRRTLEWGIDEEDPEIFKRK